MKEQYAQEWPQFFTATIQGWKHLLKEDKYKNIIVTALKFLVSEGKVASPWFVAHETKNKIIKALSPKQRLSPAFVRQLKTLRFVIH